MKISRHENFAVSRSRLKKREIKMPRKTILELDREIKMPRKTILEVDREIKMPRKTILELDREIKIPQKNPFFPVFPPF